MTRTKTYWLTAIAVVLYIALQVVFADGRFRKHFGFVAPQPAHVEQNLTADAARLRSSFGNELLDDGFVERGRDHRKVPAAVRGRLGLSHACLLIG